MSQAGTIPILEKAITLLGLVAESESGNTVKRLSLATKIPIATCYRIVRTFLKHHWLQEKEKGEYHVAFGIAHLARSYAEVEHLLGIVEPVLKELSEKTHLSAKVSLREGAHVVTVLRAEPPRINAITSPVGARYSLTIGSAATVLMADLPDEEIERVIESAPAECWRRQSPDEVRDRVKDARKQGVSWELGQQHSSIYAASVRFPLSPNLPAALSLVGWPDDFENGGKEKIEKVLRTAQDRLCRMLKGEGR